jgi:DUF2934 family protein
VAGVPGDPIQLNAFPLVFGGRSVYGSLTGTPIDQEDTLAFSVLENIRPMIETAPLEQAADAYARMMQGKARFRMVLVTKDGVAQSAKPAAWQLKSVPNFFESRGATQVHENASTIDGNQVIKKKEMWMSSKPKRNESTVPQATSVQEAETRENSEGNAARDEEIRRRAYEIYLERDGQRGRELDDWLQAERELQCGAL